MEQQACSPATVQERGFRLVHSPQPIMPCTTLVLVDIFSALTTTAYALAYGAKKVILATGIEAVLRLRGAIKDSKVIGDKSGFYDEDPVATFDFDNSPFSLLSRDLSCCTIIQYTPDLAPSLRQIKDSQKTLACSFVNAESTLFRLHQLHTKEQQPAELAFYVCGNSSSSENRALAYYLMAKLHETQSKAKEVCAQPYLKEASQSEKAQLLGKEAESYLDYTMTDVDAALALDLFSFAIELQCEGEIIAAHAVDQHGKSWRNKLIS